MIGADTARAILDEARTVAAVVRHESIASTAGPIAVSGMLAEQLAKELGHGAEQGSVQVVASAPLHSEVLIRVVAGIPTDEDERAVREADRLDVPTVLVQLWPQADWTRPFVLTPFVVECRAGEGFPVEEIADRIVDATGREADLAAGVPAVRVSVEKAVVRRAVVRTTMLGVLPRAGVRSLITLDQIRMAARLSSLEGRTAGDGTSPVASLAGTAGLVVASGVAFRELARSARRVLPAPLANGLVAGAGTWAISKAVRTLNARTSP